MLPAHPIHRRRIRRRLDSSNPDRHSSSDDAVVILGSLIRSLRAGLSLRQAIIECGSHETHGITSQLASRLRHGDSLSEICAEFPTSELRRRRSSTDEDLLVVRVIGLAHTMGGDQAGLLESVSQSIVDRRMAHQERLAQSATAMSSMRLLTWLPIVSGFWVASENPATREFLIHSRGGPFCLLTGVTLNLLGRLWAHRIVHAS